MKIVISTLVGVLALGLSPTSANASPSVATAEAHSLSTASEPNAAQVANKKGSKRVGGSNSKGKGSKYVGGRKGK